MNLIPAVSIMRRPFFISSNNEIKKAKNNLTFEELFTESCGQTINYPQDTAYKPKTTVMPSFDIVSKVDPQALDNAVNVVTKEITNRFDFKGSHVVINLDKKEFLLKLETDDDMKMRQLLDVLISRAHKQGIAPEAFDASKEGGQSGKVWKKEVKVKNGLAQEDAKKIVKLIKDSGMKVQASINDDMVRVTGKKIDDLQAVIQFCKDGNLGIPLQHVNMRD